MAAEKWHIVGGQVYRLAAVFQTGTEAILAARSLRQHRHIVITKDDDGGWAVYWRPRPGIFQHETRRCGFS